METFTPWETLNDVPPSLRTYKGARLNIDQINAIVSRAYELATTQIDEKGFPTHKNPDLGSARAEFEQSHEIVDGLWVSAGASK